MTIFAQRDAFAVEYLHPVMMGPVTTLIKTMRASPLGGFVLCPFEGFRHPGRQYHLLTRTKSTKAGPWQSDHQYGLAVDFAGCRVDNGMIVPNSWTWDVPEDLWRNLKRNAVVVGLDVPISWDKGHVSHPLGKRIRDMK